MSYTWTDGEVVTATKLNQANNGTFSPGSASAPSINFTGGTTTGLYLGASSIGFSVGGVSVGTWSATSFSTTLGFRATKSTASSGFIDIIDEGGDSYNVIASRNNANNAYLPLVLRGTRATVDCDLIVSNQCARCSGDVVKTADTTLADLTGMSITVTASGTYAVRAVVQMATTTTGGFRTTLDGTATATSMRLVDTMTFGPAAGTAVSSTSTVASLGAGNNVASTGTSSGTSIIEGTIVVNAGGTLKVQVAQNNAAGATTFYAGSYIWAQRIS